MRMGRRGHSLANGSDKHEKSLDIIGKREKCWRQRARSLSYKVPELDAHALPSLFLFPRYDKRHALRYEGDLSYDSIVKWVEAHRPGGHVHDEL